MGETRCHTLSQAREAKRQVKALLSNRRDVAIGIGRTTSGGDYAVVVYVESETAAKSLPKLEACVPVEVNVTGKVRAR